MILLLPTHHIIINDPSIRYLVPKWYIFKKSMVENHHKSNNFGLAFFACVLFLLFFHHHYCVFNSYQWKVINYIWTFEFSSLIHYWGFLSENHDWKLKCPSFQNAQRQNAHGNILPKDFMPNMTICPRRHFA